MKIRANSISLEVQTSGPSHDPGGQPRPVVLLVMGLGMQLTAWPPALVEGLVHDGFQVVCFDNRDVGLSERLDALGTPNLMWESLKYKLGLRSKPPYTLADMAADMLGVLDALNIGQAHLVGVSMGGMIGQRLALMAPSRVSSLVSIMSSSGARGLPPPRPAATRALLSRPRDRSVGAAIDHTVALFKAIGSPGFPMDEALLRERVAADVKRSYYPPGTLRQMVAVVADSQRAAALAKIRVPTLVVHGRADPLLPVACGQDTAARIPGARLEVIEGMGHDLPPGVVDRLLPLLGQHFRGARGDGQSGQPAAAPSTI